MIENLEDLQKLVDQENAFFDQILSESVPEVYALLHGIKLFFIITQSAEMYFFELQLTKGEKEPEFVLLRKTCVLRNSEYTPEAEKDIHRSLWKEYLSIKQLFFYSGILRQNSLYPSSGSK